MEYDCKKVNFQTVCDHISSWRVLFQEVGYCRLFGPDAPYYQIPWKPITITEEFTVLSEAGIKGLSKCEQFVHETI